MAAKGNRKVHFKEAAFVEKARGNGRAVKEGESGDDKGEEEVQEQDDEEEEEGDSNADGDDKNEAEEVGEEEDEEEGDEEGDEGEEEELEEDNSEADIGDGNDQAEDSRFKADARFEDNAMPPVKPMSAENLKKFNEVRDEGKRMVPQHTPLLSLNPRPPKTPALCT